MKSHGFIGLLSLQPPTTYNPQSNMALDVTMANLKYGDEDEVTLSGIHVELDKLLQRPDGGEDDESEEKRDEAFKAPKLELNVDILEPLDELEEAQTIEDYRREKSFRALLDIQQNEKKEKKQQQQKESESRKPDKAKILAGGDFLVQVHIIEGRDLKGKDGAPNPVATISIFDEKKSTKIKDSTNTPLWDQLLYFELKELEPDQLSLGKALIQVFDSKWSLGSSIMAKELIGAFEFDLSWIYYREHHEIYNEWIPLMNYHGEDGEEGNDGIGGYLKMCITVLGPGDEQYTHDEEEEQAKESGMTLVSPGIEQVESVSNTLYPLILVLCSYIHSSCAPLQLSGRYIATRRYADTVFPDHQHLRSGKYQIE